MIAGRLHFRSSAGALLAGIVVSFAFSFAQTIVTGTDAAEVAWVRHYASGGGLYDELKDMAVDQSGNLYVTGYTYGPATSADYTTAKYDPSGVEQWVRRYSNTSQYYDLPAAIAVDGAGNAFVTGRSDDSTGTSDYATIKYSPSGEQLWVARYDGPGNGVDEAFALTVDNHGNAYVTGSSGGDYATIKYDSSGNAAWVARYNGTGNLGDIAYGIAVDQLGNVYTTGSSGGTLGYAEFTTVKYDSSGTELWTSRYRYPITPSTDVARFVAVDVSGNVYVAGESVGGPGLSIDFAIVKYNSAGTEQWVMRYDSGVDGPDYPAALALDDGGNVYVTGRSARNNDDYVTIKYSSAGAEQWTAYYDGAAGGTDRPADLAVDATGNVFVTGWSSAGGGYDQFATVKYDISGIQQWVAFHGTGYSRNERVILDQNGNVYVAGSSDRSDNLAAYVDPDYTTIKYNSSGIEEWASFYRGWYHSLAYTRAIVPDGEGGLYLTGWSVREAGTEDYATIRYDSLGVEQWVRRYNGPGNEIDMASGLTVDLLGNVYVTGTSRDGSDDYATVKYDPSGVQQWVQRYNGPGNSFDGAVAITSDTPGNVYVTGGSSGSGSLEDYATIKYNPSGVQQWAARYNGSDNLSDEATAITADDAGNIYVTGWSTGLSTSRDYATLKYNSAGLLQWVARYNGPGNLDDQANAIDVDPAGNVYVTGRSAGNGTEQDWATVKYDAQGVEQWVARYASTGTGFDEAKAIALDGLGSVYVAGIAFETSYDCILVKYSEDGVLDWVRSYDGPAGAEDFANALAIDASGEIYVAGTSTGVGTGQDILAIRYDPFGNIVWETRYDEWSSPDDAASSIAVDPDGTVWIAGTSSFVNNQHISTTLKYRQNTVTSVGVLDQVPSHTLLQQNYPNPFNPSTTIEYSLPRSTYVRLEILNVLGERVKTIQDGVQDAGVHRIVVGAQGLASGVYFYRLRTGDVLETKKLLLLK